MDIRRKCGPYKHLQITREHFRFHTVSSLEDKKKMEEPTYSLPDFVIVPDPSDKPELIQRREMSRSNPSSCHV